MKGVNFRAGVWLIALAGLLAACSGAAPAAEPTAAPSPPNVLPAATALPTLTDTSAPPTEIIASPTLSPGRPTAPAGINDYFRPDPASVFAATGRPQFIEFFTFW